MGNLHVVTGGTGALGSAIVRHLAVIGRPVRAVVRNVERAQALFPENVELKKADVLDREQLLDACQDAEYIYHCINVPYNQWADAIPGITGSVLSAARASNAVFVFPGNVYGYGPPQTQPVTEDHPQMATDPKGILRNTIEAMMWDAHRKGDIRLVITRLPDYYGPNVTNPLYGNVFRAALAGKKAYWIADLDQPHALAFVDDAAAAAVTLAENESAYGQVWHAAGGTAITGREFLNLIYNAAGEKPKPGVWSEGLLKFIGLFQPQVRELKDLLYQFKQPYCLDTAKFQKAFPHFKFTPHKEAVRKTLEWFKTNP